MPTAAVILAGCGYLDGAEIREAVLTLLALDRQGVAVRIFAPDIPQTHVVNHLTQAIEPGARNVLVEAARIARSQISPLSALDPAEFDLLVCPGGFGVAKNLSRLAFGEAEVLSEFANVLRDFHSAGKPICAICIAPAVVVTALRVGTVTIGEDPGTAAHIEAVGGTHVPRPVSGILVDRDNRIVTTPAYMYGDARIADVADGIESAVDATLELL